MLAIRGSGTAGGAAEALHDRRMLNTIRGCLGDGREPRESRDRAATRRLQISGALNIP
jgi:hypothetical protein